MGPTPPEAGVIALATLDAEENSTSPTSFDPPSSLGTRLIPTSTTTARLQRITFDHFRLPHCRYQDISVSTLLFKLYLSIGQLSKYQEV